MRIINGHDYYDSALVYGHDPKVVFVRNAEDRFVDEKTFKRPYAEVYFVPTDKAKKEYHWKFKSDSLKDREGTWDLYVVRVIFCGVLYTGIRCVHRPNVTYVQKDDIYFWDRDEFEKWANQFGWTPIFKSYWNDDENMCCLPLRFTGDAYSYLIKNRIILAIYRGRDKGWELNCSGLRELQFYKVFDAVTAFQELDMWMSGALGMPGAPMVEVSDDIRMAKHGMDKWSFRKKVR